MASKLERFKDDLEALIEKGQTLELAIQAESMPKEFDAMLLKEFGEKPKDMRTALPPFAGAYQAWYSESKALIKQLLPDRLADFVRHYEKPRPRKDITYENYRIEDYLQNLTVKYGHERVVGPEAAIPHMRQQMNIVRAAKGRFESSLFDIRQLVQADLFDSEIDAARELAKKRFGRAAGALAGVVLERHLVQVSNSHDVKTTKKVPGISALNDGLKKAGVTEISQWRLVQHLADIRNLCDHSTTVEPSAAQVEDLIEGVNKIIKTLF